MHTAQRRPVRAVSSSTRALRRGANGKDERTRMPPLTTSPGPLPSSHTHTPTCSNLSLSLRRDSWLVLGTMSSPSTNDVTKGNRRFLDKHGGHPRVTHVTLSRQTPTQGAAPSTLTVASPPPAEKSLDSLELPPSPGPGPRPRPPSFFRRFRRDSFLPRSDPAPLPLPSLLPPSCPSSLSFPPPVKCTKMKQHVLGEEENRRLTWRLQAQC